MFPKLPTSHAPHLHVSYQGHKAVYRIDTVEQIADSDQVGMSRLCYGVVIPTWSESRL